MLSVCLFAQTDTSKSLKKVRPTYLSIQKFEALQTDFSSFDTSLNNSHIIHPLRKQYLPYQDLGMPGSATQNLFLSPLKTPGFDVGFHSMDAWLFNMYGADERIVIAPTPYTDLNYNQGEKELIILEATHTRNIRRRWNAGIDYRRVKANNYLFFNLDGQTYNKVRIPNIYNVKLYSSYRSKTDKYYILGSITYNKSNLRETGGLIYPESFDTTSGKRRVFENPYKNASNTINQPSIFVKQYYRFGKSRYETIELDSGHLDTVALQFKPAGYFYHSLHASRTVMCYKDAKADTPYYPAPFFTTGTNDSMRISEISNSIGLVWINAQKVFNNRIHAAVEHNSYGVYNNYYGQVTPYNLSVFGDITAGVHIDSNSLQLTGKGRFYPIGYNQKDYVLAGQALLSLGRKLVLNFGINSQQHKANQFQTVGFTNHSAWVQTLTDTRRNGIEGYAEWLPLNTRLGFVTTAYKNYYLYYNKALPAGIDFNYFNVYLLNNLRGKHWGFNNRFAFQSVSGDYHLPQYTLNGGLYYEAHYFKHNLLARLGVDYYWYSEYFADAYNPYLKQFVWQNTTKIGNYPYFDVYLSGTIQTVNFYLKFEHVNQGISGNRYYSTPFYPNNPRFFRLGINWRLFN